MRIVRHSLFEWDLIGIEAPSKLRRATLAPREEWRTTSMNCSVPTMSIRPPGQSAVHPPSVEKVAPVMFLESGDSR